MDISEIPNNIGIIAEPLDNGVKFTIYRLIMTQSTIQSSLKFKYGNKIIITPPFTEFKKEIFENINYIDIPINKINIEKNFFQSVKNKNKLVNEIKTLTEYNKKLQLDFNYYLCDDVDIEEIYDEDSRSLDNEISNLGQRAKKCAKALKAGAFKADLFRYYALYTRGGVWMDDKSILRVHLSHILFDLQQHDGFIIYSVISKLIEIAFIASRKGSPLIYAFLSKCLENIESRLYTSRCLGITGPVMAQNVFDKIVDPSINLNRNKSFIYQGYNYKVFSQYGYLCENNKNILCWKQFGNISIQFKKTYEPSYYMNQWCLGQIYIDDNSQRPSIMTRFKGTDHRLISITIFLLLFIFTSWILLRKF